MNQYGVRLAELRREIEELERERRREDPVWVGVAEKIAMVLLVIIFLKMLHSISLEVEVSFLVVILVVSVVFYITIRIGRYICMFLGFVDAEGNTLGM